MQFEQVSGLSDEQWDQWLDTIQGNLFDASSYVRYQETSGLGRPVHLLARNSSGAIEGLGVCYEQVPRYPILSRWARTWVSSALPSTPGDNLSRQRELIVALEKEASRHGVGRIDLNSFWSYQSCFISEMGYTVRRRLEFEMDLEGDEEEVFGRIHKTWRRKIRRADKEGLSMEETAEESRLEQLLQLHLFSLERKKDKGAELNPGFSTEARRALKQLLDSGMGKLFVASREGRPLSSLLLLIRGERAVLLYAGSSEEGYQYSASGFLFWKASLAMRTMGVKRFNLGGVPAEAENPEHLDHGLFRFKSDLAPRREFCCSGYKYLPGVGGTLLRWVRRMRKEAVE